MQRGEGHRIIVPLLILRPLNFAVFDEGEILVDAEERGFGELARIGGFRFAQQHLALQLGKLAQRPQRLPQLGVRQFCVGKKEVGLGLIE